MRMKLNLPENFFSPSYKIPVRITDINYGNHVGNDSLISIIHEARMQFLQSHNYTELNIEGVGLIMADIAVEFKNETFYMDIIEVQIGCGDVTNVSFELFYKLAVSRDGQHIEIALCKTSMVCYDYGLKKVVGIPGNFKKILLH
ncbi:MAG: thioesterase family protein [Chitinophagaceae bacterium]|nr:thioesterase family protein [Chitinophagaceae bacterium]